MEIVGLSGVPTSVSGERGATARHFARAFFGNLVVLLMIVAATCIATARPAQAQTASGYLGWLDQVSGTYHSSAYEACKAQWVASNMSGGGSRFIGALDTDVDFIKRCSWTSYQYICGDEGLSYCGTVLPANVSLKCSSGWVTTPAGICVQTAFDVPELPCDKCDIVNHGATLNPSVGDPIGLHTGAVARSDIDFSTHDGRFQIKRHFRSKVIGNNIAAFSSAKGLDGFWALDLMPELHLGSLYGGTLSSPSAKMAFVKPNGVGVSFKLRNDSGVNSWGLDNGYYYALRPISLQFIGTMPSNVGTIKNSSSEWYVYEPDNTRWKFKTFYRSATGKFDIGRPLWRLSPDKYRIDYTYDGNGTLQSIIDSFGRTATFTWRLFYRSTINGGSPSADAISAIDLPDGTSLKFTYDPPVTGGIDPLTGVITPSSSVVKRLIKAEHLDGSGNVLDSTEYLYEDVRYPNFLTGILDNRGVRVATYGYSSGGGFGALAQGALATDKHMVSYGLNSPETALATGPLGKKYQYTFNRVRTYPVYEYQLAKIDGLASANTPASQELITHFSSTVPFVSSIRSPRGRLTTFARDANGMPTSMTEASGWGSPRTTNLSWVWPSQPSSRSRTGLSQNWTYNSNQQVATYKQTDTTSITVPYATNGRVKQWDNTWTSVGQLLTTDGPLPGTGDTVTMTYDTSGQMLTRTDEVGHVVQVTSRDGRGAPLTVLDENGVATNFVYDDLGRTTSVTVDPGTDQSVYAMEYDLVGNMTKLTLPEGGWLEYTYDDANRITGIENDRGETQAFTYNAMNQVTSEATADASTAVTRQQSTVYDEMGRVMQTIGGGNETWQYDYDLDSNLIKTTDARGKIWNYTIDNHNRLNVATDPDSGQEDYDFALFEGLSQLTDARGLDTDRVIDGFGRTIQETSPDSGVTQYWYDEADNMTKVVDGNGITTDYTYDAGSRLLTEVSSGTGFTTQTVTYTYDDTTSGNVGIGRLTGVSDPSGSSAFVYDAQGRLTTETKAIGSQSYQLAYTYDANGQVTSITYPSGHVVNIARASDGLATGVTAQVSSGGTSTTLASNVAYMPFSGPLKSLDFGNGLVLTRSYDQNHWLTGIDLVGTSGALLDATYARDANGNVETITDTATANRNASYTYSNAGRLATASGTWGQDSYQYDLAGNRTQASRTVSSATASDVATIDTTSNRVTEVRDGVGTLGKSFTYTGSGDMSSQVLAATSDQFDYTYDARRRLAQISLNSTPLIDQAYDYAERRVARTASGGAGVHYIYDASGHLLAEHDAASGALIREYVWLGDAVIAMVDGSVSSPTYTYVHTGHLDEPLMTTDASGAVTSSITRDPWGNTVLLAGSAQIALGYPGQWHDSTTGLYQNWHRDYDPTLGRYIQTDPIGLAGGTNLYAYVNGNPVNLSDPRGLTPAAAALLCTGPQAVACGVGLAAGGAIIFCATTDVCSNAVNAIGTAIGNAMAKPSYSDYPDYDDVVKPYPIDPNCPRRCRKIYEDINAQVGVIQWREAQQAAGILGLPERGRKMTVQSHNKSIKQATNLLKALVTTAKLNNCLDYNPDADRIIKKYG